MPSFTVDGLRLTAELPASPTRPSLLLVHGIFGGAWYFERYLHFFAARGHPTYALDLRGHHGSRPVADVGRVSLADYAADVADAARWLAEQAGGAPPIVLGHSMGGLLAQKAAEQGLARALVLVASAPPRGIPLIGARLVVRQARYLPQLLRSQPIVGRAEDHEALSFNRMPAAERPELVRRLVPGSGRAGRELSLGAVAVDARRVRVPVLVVTGSDDRFVPPRIARALARKYRAPLREYRAHAHFIVCEPGWEIVAGELAGWMDEVGS